MTSPHSLLSSPNSHSQPISVHDATSFGTRSENLKSSELRSGKTHETIADSENSLHLLCDAQVHEDQGSDADVEEDADSDVSDSCYARPMIGTSHSSGARESESKNVTSPDGDSIPNTAAKSNSAPNRLIVVANRLPINFSRNSKGEWTTGFASGGLVSAMNGVKADRMTWIGWVGTEIPPAAQPAIMQQCLLHNCYPVFMSKELADDYYNGFSNHVLWPIFHYINVDIEDSNVKSDRQWEAYLEVNSLFADAVTNVYEDRSVVWTHDYHLMMLPSILRQRVSGMKIGWFLHTPFPSSEIYRALPWREELLNGVLAADLVGFHAFDYARHFKSSCTRILGLEVTHQGVEHHGRFTQVAAVPIGIDADHFLTALDSSEVQEEFKDLQRKFVGMKVLLGIDRLDYIKGIPHKILGIEKFLEKHPEWIGKIVLIQIAVPSRESVVEYQRLRSVTHELVGSVNGRFGTLDSVPIHYLDQTVPFHKMCALYRLADVAIITSLRDGMNLVSFEYVACQRGKAEAGVLILSEFAGAAQSLGAGAICVNPWNTNRLADALYHAIQMPVEERNQLFNYAFQHVTQYTAQRWARQFLTELENVCVRTLDRGVRGSLLLTPRLPQDEVIASFSAARNRLVCLGVVGCLVQKRMKGITVEQFSQMAKVPQPTLDAILRLAQDPHTTVLIMTALGRSVVDRLLGNTSAWLVPENGFFIRKGGRDHGWETMGDNVDLSWAGEVENILDYFVQRTPRSFVEREESYLSWHYRDSDPEWGKLQARNLLVHLMATPASSHGFEIVRGFKAVQVRPIGISKGFAALHCISELQARRGRNVDFILCCGSFLFRDEDLFTALLEAPELSQRLDREDSRLIRPSSHPDAECDVPPVSSTSPSTPQAAKITELLPHVMCLPPSLDTEISSSLKTVPRLQPLRESSLSDLRAAGRETPVASVSVLSQDPRSPGPLSNCRSPESRSPSTYPMSSRSAVIQAAPGPCHLVGVASRGTFRLQPFAVPKRNVYTCTVGHKPSRASFHVNGIHEVSQLLQRLSSSLTSEHQRLSTPC